MAHHLFNAPKVDIATDPFTSRMPFGSLLNKAVELSISARKRKNHREILSTLSDSQLRDIGLQRKFDGERWYLVRIAEERPAHRTQ